MPVLANIRHERFARNIAKGLSISKAYYLAGYRPDRGNAHKLYTTNHNIQSRVQDLMKKDSSNLNAQDILDHIYAVAELAFETEQCSAALKAYEMLGKEKGLFRDRRETLNINLGNMSWNELEQYTRNKYGDKADRFIELLRSYYGYTNVPDSSLNVPQELLPDSTDSAGDGARRSTSPNNLRLVYSDDDD